VADPNAVLKLGEKRKKVFLNHPNEHAWNAVTEMWYVELL
jgi:hypothetical protein